VPVSLPEQITAGTTLDLNLTLTAYPAPTWALTVLLRGPTSLDLAATPSGNSHRLSFDATTTASWSAGRYWYSVRVSDGVNVFEVDAGELTVKPDLAAVADGTDLRSHARKTLEAIEAVIEKRATRDQERYRINNRELYRTPLADLLALRDRYRREVRNEERARRGESLLGRNVLVRFPNRA